jgi:hypothetical protein
MFIMFRNSQYLIISSHWKSWCRLVWSTAVSLQTTALSSSCLVAFSTKNLSSYRKHCFSTYERFTLLLSSWSDSIQLHNSRTSQHFCPDVVVGAGWTVQTWGVRTADVKFRCIQKEGRKQRFPTQAQVTSQYCHVSQCLRRGFGFVIGFIGYLHVVTTNNYNTIADLHNLQSVHTNLLSLSVLALTDL